ncbi:MAG: TolC family protein [Blastocatellia bacterium]
MPQYIRLFVLFLLLAAPPPMPAQTPASQLALNHTAPAPANIATAAAPATLLHPVVGLRLDQAIQYALEHNKGLQADRQLIAQAAARMRQAALKANPTLALSGMVQPDDFAQNGFSIGLSVPMELAGRRVRRMDVAAREYEMMKFELAERERRLAAQVRMKYGEVVETARNLALTEQTLDLNQRNYAIVRARVSEGASAPLEQSLLQVEIGRTETQRISWHARGGALVEELKGILGMDATEALQVRDEFSEAVIRTSGGAAPLNETELVARAFRARPDLLAARAAETVATALIALARAEGRVDASLFGEYALDRAGFDQLGLNAKTGRPEPIFTNNYMIRGGLNITLPTRDKNQGNIEAAFAAGEAARLRREFIESLIRRELAATLTRYHGAASVLKTYDTELLAPSHNNLRIIRASYDLGHVRLSDVLAEQRRLVEVQLGHNAAMREFFSAHAELESIVGAPFRD